MATTTKTLTPTNQTITLPDMTERPDASILVDGIGKDADAINALNNSLKTDIAFDNAAAADANTITGHLMWTNSATLNTPYKQSLTSSANGLIINTTNNSSSNFITQLAIVSGSKKVFIRSKSSGTWDSTWSTLY